MGAVHILHTFWPTQRADAAPEQGLGRLDPCSGAHNLQNHTTLTLADPLLALRQVGRVFLSAYETNCDRGELYTPIFNTN